MTDHRNDDILARKLSADGARLTPAFSYELHSRTMRALRQRHVREVLAPRPYQWWRGALAAAASLLVAAGVWWTTDNPQMLDPMPTVSLKQIPIIDLNRLNLQEEPAPEQDPIRLALAHVSPPDLGDWEHNAQSVMRYVAQQLPSGLPAGRESKRL